MSNKEGEMRWNDNPAGALCPLGEAINQKHVLQCALGHGSIWDSDAGY